MIEFKEKKRGGLQTAIPFPAPFDRIHIYSYSFKRIIAIVWPLDQKITTGFLYISSHFIFGPKRSGKRLHISPFNEMFFFFKKKKNYI